MSDLVARLEAATEGSRELDALIMAVVTPTTDGWEYVGPVARYTTSIDAALTLVPEGWTLRKIEQDFAPSSVAVGIIWWAELRNVGDLRPTTNHELGRSLEHGRTIALSLCVAALKARGL